MSGIENQGCFCSRKIGYGVGWEFQTGIRKVFSRETRKPSNRGEVAELRHPIDINEPTRAFLAVQTTGFLAYNG